MLLKVQGLTDGMWLLAGEYNDMTTGQAIENLKAKRVCNQCVGEEYLRSEIQKLGKRGLCSYCNSGRFRCYTIDQMAARIEMAFQQHFRKTPDYDDACLAPDELFIRQGDLVAEVIERIAEVNEEVAQDIQMVLEYQHYDFEAAKMNEEPEFASESQYEEVEASGHIWHELWRIFEQSLKTEARFFSQPAAEFLASVFGGIDKMLTRSRQPLVIDAGPDTALTAIYRARAFQSEESLKQAMRRPDLEVGSPPAACANAGRMNARGISVFYGASSPNVAIAEVRPPVGSTVIVARFEIIRPLRLLDLTALDEIADHGSVFDCERAARLELTAFLSTLSQRLAKPVMPNDEAFEYLPTQAIADFLATENKPLFDGIVFSSIQVGSSEVSGVNVVLFHQAARAEAIDFPQEAKIEASTGYQEEYGWEKCYSVHVSLPAEQEADPRHFERKTNRDDHRQATLRIDLEAVKVHEVQAVQFQCEEHTVDGYGTTFEHYRRAGGPTIFRLKRGDT